ncbi:hypothetical protein ACJ41O_012359 [Fusarium nematophilum]
MADSTATPQRQPDLEEVQHVSKKELRPQTSHVSMVSASPVEEAPEAGKLTREVILAYLAMCGQINAYIMTMLIPAATLPVINAELGPDPNSTWITLNWTFGASLIVSIGGRLSDIFGRRYFMMTGAIISICGCLVGANGQSINQMIASGALFGVGSGFQELAYACVQEAVPNRYRIIAVGGLDVSLALAFTSPVVSYAFIAHQDIGWRGAYWYLFSFHCVAFLMLFLFYNPPDFEMKHGEEGETRWELVKQMDWVGVFLFLVGGALFLIGVNFGGRTYPWNHPGVLAPIILGGCCFIAVGFWCAYAPLKYPLFPPKLFRRVREFDMVIVVCFVGGMLYYSMNVLWPRQSQALFIPEGDIIMRGVYAIIFSCGTWFAGILVVFVCSRLHHEKWQLVGFTIVQTALIGSMASVGAEDKAQAIATVVLAATCITPPQLVSFTMLSFGLEDQRDLGVAVGLAGTFRLFGGAVATAIYTAIYSNRFNSTLPSEMTAAIEGSDVPFSESLLRDLIKAAATNNQAAYQAISGSTPDLVARAMDAAREAYVKGFSLVYLVAIAFGVLATIAAACTVSTDRSKKNNDRAILFIYFIKISICRLYFHPLSKYPGPLLNRISPFPLSYHLIRGRLPFYVKQLHDVYGPVVRITPTELYFNSEKSWKDIYGSRPGHQNFHKDPIHVGSIQAVPGAVTITMADDMDHARQRRALSHAFSTKALLEQECLIKTYIDIFRDKMNEFASSGRVCNIADWFSYTTFDIIGHLSLGEPFGCLTSSDLRFWVSVISESIKAGAIEQASRRLGTTGGFTQKLLLKAFATTKLRDQRRKHLEYSREKILKRINQGGSNPHRDFLHYLMNQKDKENLNQEEIIVNGALFIIAGSETTGSFMTGLFNHLLRPENREVLDRLTREIRGAFQRDKDISYERLAKLPWLTAVLEEGLRIFPSAPIGFTRTVPASGDTVDGNFLPGETTVSTCMWAATHAEDNFQDPYEFLPERWLDKENTTDKLGASNAFSLGPRGCIGRNLSYMEQRLITAKLLWHNDVAMTGDETWSLWDPKNDHENMQVFTNWMKAPLTVRLTPRRF